MLAHSWSVVANKNGYIVILFSRPLCNLRNNGIRRHCRRKPLPRSTDEKSASHYSKKLSALTEPHGSGAETWIVSLPDSPIPILQASFCSISLHIGIPTFCLRIAGRLS